MKRNLLRIVLLLAASSAMADYTVRVGEQDTCAIAGGPTITYDGRSGVGTIKFDLSKLPAGAKVEKAVLRFWINGQTGSRAWGFMRWNDEKFDGFKVFRGPAAAGEPLDTRYPFNLSSAWLYEFDVTPAARDWLADPSKNDGLSANFAFSADSAENKIQEWMRPYLQITLAGENKNRPKQPADLKAACRYGQTFLTWKLIPHTGAFFDSTYRVYRSQEPITAKNLAKAQLLGEVNRLSQLNARRTMVMRGGGYCQMGLYTEALAKDLPPLDKSKENLQAYWDRCRAALPQRCNYVIEHGWENAIENGEWLKKPAPDKDRVFLRQGPQLADDTGLFVFTVPADGKAFYAVTSVLEGNENRDDFSAANALSASVNEKKDTPRPVTQAVFIASKGPPWYTWQMRDLAYWEGGDGKLHNTPSTAFNATMDVPKSWAGLTPKADYPIWVKSHAQLNGYSVHYALGGGSREYDTGSMVMDTLFVPPTLYAPFPNAAGGSNVNWPEYGQYYYGSKTPPSVEARIAAAGLSRHGAMGMYGYMDNIQTGRDPRKAVVVPYWENRRLFEIDYMVSCFPEADPNNVIASGAWDGLNFAIHNAGRFGSVDCSMEGNWRSERGGAGKDNLVGLQKWDLKTPDGCSVWDWNDPIWYSKKFPEKEWPYITHCQSGNYDALTWQNMGYPDFYLNLAKEKRAGEYWWVNVGDAPEGAYNSIPHNQAVPAIFNVTCLLPPLPNFYDEPTGTMNAYVFWHWKGKPFLTPGDAKAQPGKDTPAALPGQTLAYTLKTRGGALPFLAAVNLNDVDEPERFEMAFRLSEHTQGFGTGAPVTPVKSLCGAADITPRRLQKFKVEKGKTYLWKNVRVSSGQVLQTGTIQPDEKGLLTAPGFFLDKDVLGNKLVITPAAGAPSAVDKAQKLVIRWFKSAGDRSDGKDPQTTEMAYAEYAEKCLRPELLLKVEPGRKFVPTMTPTAVQDVPCYSEWAWNYEDGFTMPESGRYRLEMRVKDAYFFYGAWPIIPVKIDNKTIGDRVADSTNGMTLVWWVELDKGRHRFFCGSGNNVFNESCPQVPGGKNRGLTIQNFEFFLLSARPAASSEVYQVKIRQRSAVIAPNLTLKLSADVVDPWGEPLKTPVVWKAEGAKLSAEGVFSASAEGDYVVKATAGGKTDTVKVTVKGDAFVEDFDDEWADGWIAAGEDGRDPKETANWRVWRKGTGWMGTLLQTTSDWGQKPERSAHVFVYEASAPWADVSVQADRLPGNLDAAQGLVFRYQNPTNYYRFERRAERNAKTAAFKIVKVLDGVETVLGSADKEIPPLEIKPSAEYRTFQYWNPKNLSGVKPFQIDRFRVEVKGEEFKAFLNGQEVLAAKDAEFKQGAAGLYCNGQVTFDNFEAKEVKP